MASRHTDSEYEAELRELREHLLLMAGRVESMIAGATRALIEHNADLARETIAADARVDRDEVELDDLCLRILAKRQPVASDLRSVTLTLKMVTDIERIGDLAVNICERVIDLAAESPLKPYEDTPRMGELARAMLGDAIDAFVSRDIAKARAVIAHDAEIDALYTRVFRDVLAIMVRDPQAIERGIHIQSIAKWIERIGDHTTNLAEEVIFLVEGTDVRHQGRRSPPPAS
ncbi:MAG: phosphate signaling complex protein PhoU [Myxococcota bacterium]